MKKINKAVLSICLTMLFGGCDELMTESYTSSSGSSSGSSEGNDMASSIADDIVSGIDNKVGEIGANASAVYLGGSDALTKLSEELKSDNISSEMKNSKLFKVLTSILWNDCVILESGSSFEQPRGDILSLNYRAGTYNLSTNMSDYSVFYFVYDRITNITNGVNDEIKEYYIEKESMDFDGLIGEYLEIYLLYAKGKIVDSGKETVFGKEMEYEDISVCDEVIRFYFDGDNTAYRIDTLSGSYSKLSNNTDKSLTVPFGYRLVSAEQFAMDLLESGQLDKNMEEK